MNAEAAMIRLAHPTDAQPISDIYNHYVAHCTCTFQIEPETLKDRQEWLHARSEQFPVTVACASDHVIAWASLSPWHSRCAYAKTTEFSIYVHHDYHRNGIGKALLKDLITRAKRIGHHVMIGGACSEQVASIKLQESLGFVQVGNFRQVGRKFDRWLDVVYLQLMLNDENRDNNEHNGTNRP